jgi:hypothetical protein
MPVMSIEATGFVILRRVITQCDTDGNGLKYAYDMMFK